MRLLDTILAVKQHGVTVDILKVCSRDELRLIHRILDEYEETGSSGILDALWREDFDDRPVSIDEFLDNDYYLGKVGCDLFPKWRPDLRKVCSPLENITEWIIKGGIGIGKSYVAVIALLYKMYYISCLRDPQRFYGLGQGTPIVFGFFNIYKYLVRATSYQYLTTWLRDMSPYFKRWRVPKEGKETDKNVLTLPKHMSVALGAQAIHALGQNILGGLADEAEFGKSKSMTSTEKSQIADLYGQVRDRIDSRFMQAGGANPGLLILISSAKDYESFLEPHTKARRDEETVHVSSYALYEVRTDKFGESDTFKVELGDKFNQSRILTGIDTDDVQPREGSVVIDVPVEFLPTFRFDIDTAIRNVAGVPTRGSLLFYPQRNQLKALLESCKRRHPFSIDTVELSLSDEVRIEDYFLIDDVTKMVMKSSKIRAPRHHPKAYRYVHVDLAKNRDAAGLAMVCLPLVRGVDRVVDDRVIPTSDFVVFADIMLRIKAAEGSEIDFSKVSGFILFLRKVCRFLIRKVTYDQYQSTESIQKFKKLKILSEELSVDRNPGPYRALKQICREGRFDGYYYDPFYSEMIGLEDRTGDGGSVKNKIDHQIHGCFTADTKVSLLDGSERSLEDLYNDRDDVWVYSVDAINNRIIPAIGSPVYAGEQNTIIIVLDTNDKIECTHDHLFMMFDGSYKRACDLSNGDSLMPLYRSLDVNGYELLVNPFTAVTEVTHKVSDLWNLENCFDDTSNGGVRHHKNFNKRDNRPTNLERMDWFEHLETHKLNSSLQMYEQWCDPVFREIVTETARKQAIANWAPGGRWRSRKRDRETIGNFRSDVSMVDVLDALSTACSFKEACQEVGISMDILKRVVRDFCGGPWKEVRNKFIRDCMPFYNPRPATHLVAYNKSVEGRRRSSEWMTELNNMYGYFKPGTKTKPKRNHSVVAVTNSRKAEVFCLDVPGSSNFALSVGVFVHNSKDVADGVCGASFSAMRDKKGIQPGAETDEIKRRAEERAKAQNRRNLMTVPSPESTRRMLVGDISNPLDKLFKG